jgi:hypothetical protein
MTPRTTRLRLLGTTFAAGALSLAGSMASADIIHADDVIIQFSLCVGNDCVNGESFGFDTLRLKENNLRLHFDDTSSSASFPRNDWRFTANDSSNGGSSYMAIEDVTGGRIPFRTVAGAPSHSLYIDAQGDVGMGTNNPVVEVHIADGDTPTVRLEQNGTSGWTPQTWDLAGNETNFFIRDVTNGSKLPFRIRPNAPTDSLTIEGTTGDIGVGVSLAAADMHIRRTTQSTTEPTLLIENTGTTANGNSAPNLQITDLDGRTGIAFNDGSVGDDLVMELRNQQDDFLISFAGTGANELTIKKNGRVLVGNGDLEVLNGNLEVSGNVVVGGTTLNVPDYVFAPDYDLMPLHEVEKFIIANSHLPNIPSAMEVSANGLNMTEMQISLLEKVEELTLYTLQQQKTIDALQAQVDALR